MKPWTGFSPVAIERRGMQLLATQLSMNYRCFERVPIPNGPLWGCGANPNTVHLMILTDAEKLMRCVHPRLRGRSG